MGILRGVGLSEYRFRWGFSVIKTTSAANGMECDLHGLDRTRNLDKLGISISIKTFNSFSSFKPAVDGGPPRSSRTVRKLKICFSIADISVMQPQAALKSCMIALNVQVSLTQSFCN